MKKLIIILFALFMFFSSIAQLANTKWVGILKGDNPRNVFLDFKKDTFTVYTVSDNEMVERMTYTLSNGTFTVKKIDGQSDCDNTTPGKYSFKIDNGKMFLKVMGDECNDRSSALDTTKWRRWKDHKEVKLSENILKQYVGVYEFNPQHHLTISLENGILYIEGPNNNLPKTPLTPESNTKFLIKIAAVEIDFVKDAGGKVIKFISHEDEDYTVKKIK